MRFRVSGVAIAVLVTMSNLGSAAVARGGREAQAEVPAAATEPMQLAQAAPTPFCRRPNRRLDVYSLPSVAGDSASRAIIERDTDIFLVEQTAGDGFVIQDGFVQAIVPSANSVLGYVIARHLKGCGNTPTPQPPQPQAQCATVVVPFLNVRAAASVLARTIGNVSQGQTVRITGDSQGSVQSRRTWVSFPFSNTTGWIAETGASGELRNLSNRFPCPQ